MVNRIYHIHGINISGKYHKRLILLYINNIIDNFWDVTDSNSTFMAQTFVVLSVLMQHQICVNI